MFIFARLLLAHFVADFPLQVTRIYEAKTRSLRGQVLHAAMHGAMFTIFLFPFLRWPITWFLICILSLAHFPVDWLKVSITKRWPNLDNVYTFLMDQALHILTLALVFVTPLCRVNAGELEPTSMLMRLYLDNGLVYFLIVFLAATWGGAFFIGSLEKTVRGEKEFSTAEKWHGIIERSFFLLLPLAGYTWMLLAIPVLLLRPLIANRLEKANMAPGSIGSIAYGLVSLAIGLGAGLLIRYF